MVATVPANEPARQRFAGVRSLKNQKGPIKMWIIFFSNNSHAIHD